MYQPPDGRKRSAADERQLNEAFATTFNDKAGELVLDYLEHITLRTAAGPGVDPNHLMHLEGQRFIVGLIAARVRHGKNHEPSETQHGKPSRRNP
jgi:hypothetical protein